MPIFRINIYMFTADYQKLSIEKCNQEYHS